jgi:hypothetical protein
MLIIYLFLFIIIGLDIMSGYNTKFHIPIFNGSLIIAVKLNTKRTFFLSRHLVIYILREPMFILLYTFCPYFVIRIKFTK